MKALVVGAGFAGTAAAWALQRLGAEVALVWEGAGASELYSGALDAIDWSAPRPAGAARRLEPSLRELLGAFGTWALDDAAQPLLATAGGVVRSADLRDRALLSLAPLAGRKLAVIDWGRPGYDAPWLARAWSQSAWARETRTELVAVSVEPPSREDVRRLSDVDLATCFDEPAWQAATAEKLASLDAGFEGLLLGPWLGSSPDVAEVLRRRVGRALGETTSEAGGVAGLRFEVARDAWLGRARIAAYRGKVLAVEPAANGYRVQWRAAGAAEPELLGDGFGVVVLALGGVLGGGICYAPGERAPRSAFSLSLEAPVELRLDGRDVALIGGSEGADLVALGFGALERVGVLVDEQAAPGAPGLFAAGDVVAGRPRTALEAMRAALGAASAAARFLGEPSDVIAGELAEAMRSATGAE